MGDVLDLPAYRAQRDARARQTAAPPLTPAALAEPALMIGAAGFAFYAASVMALAQAALFPLSLWRR